MPHPYDATMKFLFDEPPEEWLPALGIASDTRIEVRDSDLSTVTSAADRIFYVEDPEPTLHHIEFQAARQPDLPRRTLAHNSVIFHREGTTVWSDLILMRREADERELTGRFEYGKPGKESFFRYGVIRLWELPVETMLEGGMALVPLTVLCGDARERWGEVAPRIRDRLREAPRERGERLWTAVLVLMGLRYSEEERDEMSTLMDDLKESWVYQEILQKGREEGEAHGRAEGEAHGRAEGEALGRAEGARRVLLRLGEKQFGGPPPRLILSTLDAIDSVEALEAMTDRILDAERWEDLLTAE